MATFSFQTWNSIPFTIERKLGKTPGTVILRFCGPFTTRDAYSVMPPLALKKMLELEPEPGEEPLTKNILDLASCPYMDSSGVGMIVSHFVHCQKKGVKMIAVGLSAKVKDVFRITKVDSVIPLAATVEDADIA